MSEFGHGWIGCDLDGTLAYYTQWSGPGSIGEPIPAMLDRVKGWIAEGKTVKIFTARASRPEEIPPVKAWCVKHGLGELDVTNVKDFQMQTLYDDRCVQVVPNTGELVGGPVDDKKIIPVAGNKVRR